MAPLRSFSFLSVILFSLQLFLLLQSSYSRATSQLSSGPRPSFGPHEFSRKVVLEVTEKVIAADCTKRPSAVVNGTFPGPELRFKAGDKIKVTVINLLKEDNITIHFHGLSTVGAPFSDGTEKIAQYAIPPAGGKFDYIFLLDSPGTYIYHAHVGFKLMTCHGAFIVEDAHKPPFKYDEERVLLFADYYHNLEKQIELGVTSVPFQWLGEPQSMVVNGNALGKCNANSPFGCTTDCRHHRLVVKPGMTYRVRVIGITVLTYLYIGIEDHEDLSVIEVDSGYVRPASTKHIQLHSGQRYSFLLKTKSREELKKLGSKRDFWGRIETRWRPIRDQGAFVLHYEDEASTSIGPSVTNKPLDLSLSPLPEPKEFKKIVDLPNEGNTWLADTFEPLDPKEVAPTAAEVTRRILIQGQQLKMPDGHIYWFVNGEKYVETQPKVPFLVRAYTSKLKPDYKAAEENNGFDKKLGAYPIKFNDVVEIVIVNQASSAGTSEIHPWHLHGQEFYVVAHGTGEFTKAKLAEAEAHPKRHIRRDTEIIFASQRGASYTGTTVTPGMVTGWMVLRMKARTPGAFLMHCHTQPHVFMGMGVVIVVGIEDLPPLPPGVLKDYVKPTEP
ncbi:L-ascorbate oxidase [Puccinia triticina 1-1 BBBD Race 1]|uniref:laccase n=2 Tax=Puccinia triticina TaxID=208348 RepID=A0A180GU70_PUCT1|nr:uncharacterized protein PtA15_5A252 [Puccinia triticina]OAV96101.1 L-ascorbate oxidase [Puccinia triticina 1-1 BBBD Race 1]WAQ84679.1 hypothetical protein PtA15_5A252 [Puccinia triticina]WAR58024.1 hypothetical protein PtB15_5B255 [Puccinia triticina]